MTPGVVSSPHYTTLQKFSARNAGAGDCRRDDSDDWAGGGRAGVCQNLGGDGRHQGWKRPPPVRIFRAGVGRTKAEVGEGFDHRALWQLAAVESGAGLGDREMTRARHRS